MLSSLSKTCRRSFAAVRKFSAPSQSGGHSHSDSDMPFDDEQDLEEEFEVEEENSGMSCQVVPLHARRFSQSKNCWKAITADADAADNNFPSSFRLLTWNVDFMQGDAETRLLTALSHIQNQVFRCEGGESPVACCILLQEIRADVFPVLLEHSWIRAHFIMVPMSSRDWPGASRYGNVTLISRKLPVASASSLVFPGSVMGRNAILADIKLSAPSPSPAAETRTKIPKPSDTPTNGARTVIFRVANTHLESLPMGAIQRPLQMELIASALRAKGIYGGIVGGDMNAIGRADRSTPADVGLVDAWVGSDDDKRGFTWGYQPPTEFAPGRLDKLLYISSEGCTVDVPEIVGVGVKTESGMWASDHYGLITTVSLVGSG